MDDSEDPSIAETSANAAAGLIPATRQKLINAAGSFSFTSFLSSIRPLNQYPFVLQGATSAQLGNEMATEPNGRLDFTQYVVELHFLLTKFSFPLPIKKATDPQSRPINLSAIAKKPSARRAKSPRVAHGPANVPVARHSRSRFRARIPQALDAAIRCPARRNRPRAAYAPASARKRKGPLAAGPFREGCSQTQAPRDVMPG